MPPKQKDSSAAKKAPPTVRPPISESSLVYVPTDAFDGYQERIESGIDWTNIERARLRHKYLCEKPEIPKVTFSEALHRKIKRSVLNGFIDEESGLSLDDHWELLLPITLWDVDKCSDQERQICFLNDNHITDDLVKLVKKVVKAGDRGILLKELKLVPILRINDSKMTELDSSLLEFKNLVSLNICGNFISEINPSFLPRCLRTLELQTNNFKNLDSLGEQMPPELNYLGLARNFLTNDGLISLTHMPFHLMVLDLSDNDIYHLEPLLDCLTSLPSLTSLLLVGNPCSVCASYARTVLSRLPRLQWLDNREVMPADRVEHEPHPDDLRSTYFNLYVFRIMSVPQPPKPEKGAVTAFYVEVELPLLDGRRRQFLMFRRHESLVEMLPPPEDDWTDEKQTESRLMEPLMDPANVSSEESCIYDHMVLKNPLEVRHFTTFQSVGVQWNKVMNFPEPAIRLFCPDLVALRNTFRSVITVRLVYTVSITPKTVKEKKGSHAAKLPPEEHTVTIASVKCILRNPDWSQPSQHFHWDDSLGTDEAIHWGDGDLSVLQYSILPIKPVKGKTETDVGTAKQLVPDNLTCHFGFGIDTIRS